MTARHKMLWSVAKGVQGAVLTGVIAISSAVVVLLSSCGAPTLPRPPRSNVTGSGVPTQLRGLRYCEVLIGGARGAHIVVEVYNSIGLGDCPDSLWTELDGRQLEKELGAEKVMLNGPRYWMIDRLDGSQLVDPTPRDFHGIAMRMAARLEPSISEAFAGHKPYLRHDIRRTTAWYFEAGKPVFELIDREGRVYVMQSYSVQKTPQTVESLASLGERLKLPAGWSFRTRTLESELKVPAVDGMAHVVQDDFENTYQQAQ